MRLIPGLLTSIVLCLVAALSVPSPASAQVPGLGSLTGAGSSGESGESGSGETQVSVDPVELLLQVLQDDEARARLVDQLQAAVPEDGAETDAAAGEEEEPQTIGQRLATILGNGAAAVTERARGLYAQVARIPNAFAGLSGEEMDVVVDALRDLILIIAVTVAIFVGLRAIAKPIYVRIGNRARERPAYGRILHFVGAGLMDFGIVILAWAAGNAVALLVFGDAGEARFTQVLYLTAFLVVELGKAAFRLLLSPSTGALRPLNLSDWAARRVYRVVRMTVSILGYGFIVVLTLVAQNAGYAEGRSTAALIWVIAIIYLAIQVVYYRRPVGTWLTSQAVGNPVTGQDEPEAGQESGTGNESSRGRTIVAGIAHAWHWLVLAWLAWLALTVMGRQGNAVGELLGASGKVALALGAGLVLSDLLGRAIRRGIVLPQHVTERVPLLEKRLNRYVPRLLLLLRIVILVGVVVYAFHTLNLVNPVGWIGSDFGLRLTGAAFSVVLILLFAFLLWLALTSWIDYRLNPTYGTATAREQTLLTLFRNAATIAILVFTLMFVLSEIGLNIGPLLASAGVVGLAIGFGAQKMVQDIITGIFIQFENAINVGDVVAAGGITGAVERLTVRSVSLRDLSGIYHIIPFSSVDTVSNYTKDFSYYVVDMGVAYREDVGAARQAMFDAFDELRAHPEVGGFVLDELEWFGLDSFGDSAVMLKARIKTWPAQQWGVGRAYNEILKGIFDERGIEIPFPQRTLWMGEGKEGGAPPLRVTRDERDRPAATEPSEPVQDAPETSRPTQDGPTDGE